MDDFLDLFSALSGNKYVQTILFIGGTFTTLYQLFKDGPSFLKRQFKLPIWAIIIIILITGWSVNRVNSNNSKQIEPKDFKEFKGEVFGQQTIDIAGKRFLRCDFRGTTLRVTGISGCVMIGCRLTDGTRFSYAGPAQRTLSLLTELYKFPEVKPIVDTLFSDIRNGTIPETPPVNSSVKE